MGSSENRADNAELSGIGGLLGALLPRASRFDYYGSKGDFRWSNVGTADRSISGCLLSLPGGSLAGGDEQARELRLPDGGALHVFPLADPATGGTGLFTCAWPGPASGVAVPSADKVFEMLQPALGLMEAVLADRELGRQTEALMLAARSELDLLYDLDEQLDRAPHGQAQLAHLVRTCAHHLRVGYSVLILPSKRIRISVTHPSWKGADRRALDNIFVKRFLPSLKRRRSPSVLDIAQVPHGVGHRHDGYQVMLCPLREGGHGAGGVLALAGQTRGRRFGAEEQRFASLITRKAERVIESNYDPLTGLVNRSGFEAHLRESYNALRDDEDAHSLVIFDIDKLQLVNDTFGHSAGDDLVRRFAAELQDAVPDEGVATRLSGDNFAVLLHRMEAESAVEFAEEVRRRTHKLTYMQGDKALQTTVSAGVAAYRRDSGSVSGALVAPKVACTAAKEHGGDRVEVYDQDDHSIIRRAADIRLVARIHNALDNGDFELVAQPIAALTGDHRHHYHEVLVRMCAGEDDKLMLPEGFMSAAERYQLMPRLDRWIVGRALEMIGECRSRLAERPHTFALNLSGQSLGDDEFLDFVRERVEAADLPAGSLCFEITETAAVANMDRAKVFIDTMRSLGCLFALDDFGAGLSSFAYLKNFAIDSLKIDGSFVKDVSENRVSEAMVAAITQVARVMGLKTVAEYVISDPVRRKVQELGVDFAQGFFVGEPVPLGNVLARVAARDVARRASAS